MKQSNNLNTNLILQVDSYKSSHAALYPQKMNSMHSYVEARIKGETIVPFGLQMWIKKTLLDPITVENIDEAESFMKEHGEPFDRAPWEKVVNVYNGFLPITIRSVKEGTRIPSQNVIATVECTDPDLFWLSSYLETNLQRGIWYPTTIASNDYKNMRVLKRYWGETCDSLDGIQFALHDFGNRGVSSRETAEIGGAAHLVYFMGSDTVDGVRAANYYYNSEMSGFSVPATEHTVQCSYGAMAWDQRKYLEKVLETYAKPGSIVSLVIDGYDVMRESLQLCQMKEEIIKSGAKIVFRPDSGDMMEIVTEILKMQDKAFGSVKNTKGFKVINNVGVLQGDGIDTESMTLLLEKITSLGFAASNLVFGSGGGLLQKVNRDTYKFAQKASSVKFGDTWKDIFKDPITDPGKKSKTGRLTLLKSKMTGEYMTAQISDSYDSEFEDVMVTVYENGKLYNEMSLDEIRKLANS